MSDTCPKCGANDLVRQAALWLVAFSDTDAARAINALATEHLDNRRQLAQMKADWDRLAKELADLRAEARQIVEAMNPPKSSRDVSEIALTMLPLMRKLAKDEK